MKTTVLFLGLVLVTGALGAPVSVAADSTSGVATTTDTGLPIGPHVFGALRARSIGPAIMSGRISALDVSNADPRLMFIGTAGGGVWRTRDGAVTFESVFDDHIQSIGCVTLDQARPDTVWVGTGETWVRNSVGVGDGLYRTVDGGTRWEKVGFGDSERIAEVIIHPDDPATVYVAVLGHLWDDHETRGVYRTTDFGATWEQVLAGDPSTGCADLAMDPQDPDILYAALWQFRRGPDFFTSGGPGSGLFKSMDGGTTWRPIRDGLPEGDLGRIAVTVMPSRPSVLYAAVEAEVSGFYRSDDLGESWRLTTEQRAIKGRPFYFHHLVPDPQDHERIYKMNTFVLTSRDGGEIFGGIGGWVHADGHDMWINPANPKHIVLGTDGGLYVSYDRGGRFRHAPNLPISQFYRVSVDQRTPYRVYGGLQDNGSWYAPSRSPSGVENRDWENVGGGDGFCVVVDRGDPDIVYWEWQGGNVNRHDLRTGEDKDIRPRKSADGPDLRFHWNTPITTSPTDATRLYVGSQFLHRSGDRGETWTVISPDLTTDDPDLQRQEESGGLTIDNTTAENHCTIFAVAESPLDKATIWVGTDDGNVQLTTDDGASWRRVAKDLEGLPAGTWVSCVEPSRHDAAEAFVTFDGHRRGDRRPHVYRTADGGETWQSLVTEDITGHAHVIRQDPVNGDLLYLGTEEGLFISLDRGLNWARFSEGVPPVSVRDMALHERDNALVLGTHGRGILVIDDLRPLRVLTAEVFAAPVSVLPSRAAVLRIPQGRSFAPGNTHYAAGNPTSSAVLMYYLSKRHLFGEMKIEIFTPEGELLKTLPGGKRKGLNMVTWSPRLKPPRVAPSPVLDPATSYAGAYGPAAPEGVYTWRLTKGKQTHEGTVEVGYAPDYPHDEDARGAQQAAVRTAYDMLDRLAYVAEAATSLRDDARDRAAGRKEKDKLARRLHAFADDVDRFHGSLMVTDEVQGISGRRELREKVVRLYAAISGYGGAPSPDQLTRLDAFAVEIDAADAGFADLCGDRLADLNKRLAKADLAPLVLLSAEDFAASGQ